MCLTLTKDSARLKRNLRRRKKPVVCYKVLTGEHKSPFQGSGDKWEEGLQESNRSTTILSKVEHSRGKVYTGFHFYLKNPQTIGPYPCPCPYQYPRQYPFPYPCQHPYPCPMVVCRCTVEPEDIVAVGEWDSKICIVATKVTKHEELGRLWETGE